MRQSLFAIVLIIAAFSGGALVNGPGLEWGRRHLASVSKHLPDEWTGQEEPLPDDESPEEESRPNDSPRAGTIDAQVQPPSSRVSLPVAESSPFAPSSLHAEETSSREFTPPDDQSPEAAPTVKAPLGPTIATQSSPLDAAAPDVSSSTPKDLPAPPPSLLDLARRKLSDRGLVEDRGDASAPSQTPPPAAEAGEPPQVSTAGASASSEARFGSGGPEGRDLPPGAGQDRPPANDPSVRLASRSREPEERSDWAEVRHQMVELGVGRYWVEGEFGGPVIFRCVVPMIGDRAVSQHFEAEGDDLMTAARVTLRRIALWRATEESP
ncbi:hypothetical protein AB1L88_02415 [Tautonia sp. JC769]|uniref:hypothetical protein n=1 Tax=Tautonia sp. JC769 TaxID=3232135 RepID=UPI00345A84C6